MGTLYNSQCSLVLRLMRGESCDVLFMLGMGLANVVLAPPNVLE